MREVENRCQIRVDDSGSWKLEPTELDEPADPSEVGKVEVAIGTRTSVPEAQIPEPDRPPEHGAVCFVRLRHVQSRKDGQRYQWLQRVDARGAAERNILEPPEGRQHGQVTIRPPFHLQLSQATLPGCRV